MTRDERFERRASHAEQTYTFLKVKNRAVSAFQNADLGDLREAGELAFDHERPAETARSIISGNEATMRRRPLWLAAEAPGWKAEPEGLFCLLRLQALRPVEGRQPCYSRSRHPRSRYHWSPYRP
jgi:hypothetical protein